MAINLNGTGSITGLTSISSPGISGVPVGSASAPAFSFTGDSNTGIYSPGADQLAISTNSSQRLLVDSVGNVGVGGAPSSNILECRSSTNSTIGITRTASHNVTLNAVAGGAFTIGLDGSGGSTERLRITSAGLLGVGTSSPQKKIHLVATSSSDGIYIANTTNSYPFASTGYSDIRGTFYDYQDSGQGGGESIIRLGSDNAYAGSRSSYISFLTSPANGTGSATEKVRITPSGNVGIGTSTPGHDIDLRKDAPGSTVTLRVRNDNVAADSNSALVLDTPNGVWGLRALRSGARLAVDIGGSEKAAIDTSGRLLVGTSTNFNGYRGQFESTDFGQLSIRRNVAGAGGPGLAISHSRGSTSGSVTALVNNDEFGGIYFYGADGTQDVPGAAIYAAVDGTPGTNDMPGRLVFSTTADGASSPTERMRITQDGDVFINHNSSTSPVVGGEKLGVVGVGNIAIAANTTTNTTPTLFLANGSDTNNAYVARFSTGSGGNTRGEIYYNGSQLVYATSSDYRLKENVVSFDAGIEIVKQLRPVKYNWIENGNEDIGFIAHEVQAVFPNAVGGEKDAVDDNGKILPQTYDPSKLVPLLTAALQEAVAKIESLEARLTAAGI